MTDPKVSNEVDSLTTIVSRDLASKGVTSGNDTLKELIENRYPIFTIEVANRHNKDTISISISKVNGLYKMSSNYYIDGFYFKRLKSINYYIINVLAIFPITAWPRKFNMSIERYNKTKETIFNLEVEEPHVITSLSEMLEIFDDIIL